LLQNAHKSKLFPSHGLLLPSPTGGGGRYSEVGVLGRAARAASSTGVLTLPSSDTLDRFSGRPRATITAIVIATTRRMTGAQRILQTVAPSSLKSREVEMGHYVGMDVGKDRTVVCDHRATRRTCLRARG
jgi:hypothetical protein